MLVNDAECEAAGLDPKKVEAIARRLSRAAKDAQSMGMQVFGGSGSGTLRYYDGNGGALIIASLDGHFDGGDGSESEDAAGLMRGEHDGRFS